jgi:hypothetical protein
MIDASYMIPPCRDLVIHALNEIQPITDKLRLLTELAPLVDESPDKGRLAIGLLEMAQDYLTLLDQALEKLAQQAHHEEACR